MPEELSTNLFTHHSTESYRIKLEREEVFSVNMGSKRIVGLKPNIQMLDLIMMTIVEIQNV